MRDIWERTPAVLAITCSESLAILLFDVALAHSRAACAVPSILVVTPDVQLFFELTQWWPEGTEWLA